MSTEVLLMDDVADLGVAGDVVKVADGYARNYLMPKNLAAPATQATRRKLAKLRKEREIANKAILTEAHAMASRLAQASCTITVKTGADDQLYGSVTTADISTALASQGIEIDRHDIQLDHPIKELGCFEVKIKLHPEVQGSVKVWVVEE